MSSALEMTELCVLRQTPACTLGCLGVSGGHLGETRPKGKGSLLGSNKAMAVMDGYIASSVPGLCIQPGYPLTRLRSISERALGKVLLINSQGSTQRDNTASPCSNVG